MREPAQPMPDRLKVRTSLRILKWLTTAADRLGVGLNAVEPTIKPSICSRQQRPAVRKQVPQLAMEHCGGRR